MDAYQVRSSSAAIGVLFALVIPATAAAAALPAGSTSPASTSAPTAPTCGNETLPADPGGGQWRCSFDDEFDSTTGDASSLDTSWWTPQLTATSGFASGPSGYVACYVDSSDNISVSDGALHLTVRKESAPFQCGSLTTQYTGGMVSTGPQFDQTYGRFEVRALLPQTVLPGLQETLWLYPQNLTYGPWPASGEVDFAEFYSLYSLLDVPYIHYNYDSSLTDLLSHTNITTADCVINPAQYNTYAVTWEPGSFTITSNGATCLIDKYQANGGLSATAPFDQPFFIALTQGLGIGTNAYNPLLTPLPATTSIDYVRAWTGSGSGPGSTGSGSGGSGSTTSTTAPARPGRLTITGVHETVSRWRVAHGTTFEFTLNRAATVKLIFRHIVHGHKLHGRCVATRKRHGASPRCQLNAPAGRLAAIRGHAGRNQASFHGRLSGGHRLAPGSYTVTITAAAVSSHPLHFTVTAG
jgi:beta-glucanase (GH16 family)